MHAAPSLRECPVRGSRCGTATRAKRPEPGGRPNRRITHHRPRSAAQLPTGAEMVPVNRKLNVP
jgi:hypothetical protein